MRELSPRALWLVLLLPCAMCGDSSTQRDAVDVDGDAPDGGDGFDPNDPDGDGLTTEQELLGWPIVVDETALPQGVVFRTVTSDPHVADTDGDGLSDLEERIHRCDPRARDTDGDGLDDFAEVTRWRTSPTSVDTDGDSRGQNPRPGVAPDVALWDGAELSLRPDPFDPSGPMIADVFATSPLQPDTDGDGVWDFDEGAIVTRSSSVAELPRIEVGMMNGSMIDVGLNVTITEGTATTKAYTSTTTKDETFNVETSDTVSHTMSMGVETAIGASAEGKVTLGSDVLTSGGALSVEAKAWVTSRTSLSMSVGAVFSGSEGWSRTTTKAYDDMREETRNKVHTVDGGFLRMALTFKNVGELTVTLTDLAVPVFFPDMAFGQKKYGVHKVGLEVKSGAVRPLGTLRPDVDEAQTVTLAPGEVTTILMEARDLDAGRVELVMRWPRGLLMGAPQFEILDRDGNNYDFRAQAVGELTADLVVDLGPGRVERWRVATNYGFGEDGTSEGTSALDALQRVGIRVATQTTTAPTGDTFTIYTMGDVATALHANAGPDLGDPPYVRTDGPGERWVKRGWFALIQRRMTPNTIEFVTDLARAMIRAGDRVTITMLEDLDQDGISGQEESIHGSSDLKADTDNDGLSDFFEIREGWDVFVRGQAPALAWPSPRSADVDGDGLGDVAEHALGTDPNRRDTDLDGYDDKREADDEDEDPLVFSDHFGPGGHWCPLEPSETRFELNLSDQGQNLVGVRIDWDDDQEWHVLGYEVPDVEDTPFGEWSFNPVGSYQRTIRSGRRPLRVEAWDSDDNRSVITKRATCTGGNP